MESEGSLPHSQVPATCHVLNQIDPVHAPTSHFLKIHLNVILPHKHVSSKWSLSLRFPHQNLVYVLHAPPISFFSIWSPEQYVLPQIKINYISRYRTEVGLFSWLLSCPFSIIPPITQSFTCLRRYVILSNKHFLNIVCYEENSCTVKCSNVQ